MHRHGRPLLRVGERVTVGRQVETGPILEIGPVSVAFASGHLDVAPCNRC